VRRTVGPGVRLEVRDMSGQGRLTVHAVLATLMTAGSLLPLVDPAVWFLQAAALVGVIAAVGSLARSVPLARVLTVAVQALAALVVLTVIFAPAQAPGGVVPGPAVMREFGRLLAQGGEDVGRYAAPAPVTDGIGLLLVGGVAVIGLLVDAVAVTYRSAAPAGLPLLGLYSVAAGLSQGGVPWLWFLSAAGGYLQLLLADGRDRLSRWGRLLPGASPAQGRPKADQPGDGAALAPVRTGRRIAGAALGIALLAPSVLPSLSGGLLAQQRVGDVGPGAGGDSAVQMLVSLQNNLNQSEDREVLTYRTTPDGVRNMYLRIAALDRFDGASWKPSGGRGITGVPSPLPPPPGLGPKARTAEVETLVTAAGSYRQSRLPMPYPATGVRIGGRWRFEPESRTLVGDRGQTTAGARYTVSSLRVQPDAADLAAAGPPPAKLLREYTQVPDGLPEVVERTARSVTAGAANAYEQAVRLQDWFAFEGGFTYDTQAEAGSGTQAITRFLRQKDGFCVHFSFSMAAMARTLGIPARVAVGFTPGAARPDGTMSVSLRDAHAWPELYFQGAGWTRFEPTPSRGTTPDYAAEETPSGEDAATAPRPAESAAPRPAPGPSQSCTVEMKRIGGCETPAAQASGAETGRGLSWRTVAIAAALAGLVLAVPVLPVLVRAAVRRRRLGSRRRGPAGGDAASRTLAAWTELTDSAWDHGILPDGSRTPRQAAARIVLEGRLDQDAAESAYRIAAAVEQVLYAPRPRPAGDPADDVRRAVAGLRAMAGRRARLRALLAPRSAVRAVWVCSGWWDRTTARRPVRLRPRTRPGSAGEGEGVRPRLPEDEQAGARP
jgi:transglutaminase-like putative cysteine protease